MNRFEYAPISKFLYRYAIVPLSLVLFLYFFVQISNIGSRPLMIIPALINLAVLYMANTHYYKSYSTMPFLIIADKEKLTVSNFMLGKKTMEIKYTDIDNISGGVFGYNRKGLIYIHDDSKGISIGIHPSILNVDNLIKIILNNINKELREDLVIKLKRWEENE